MPQTGGVGGIQLGDSPITSGVSGVTRGLLEALCGTGGASPGVVELEQPDATAQYMNVDDDGRIRLGTTDPDGSPEINPLLAYAAGALLTDGTNWMTGNVEAKSTIRMKSRRNLFATIDDIDDEFAGTIIDDALWSIVPSGTPAVYSITQLDYLELKYVSGNATVAPRQAGLKSKYVLQGNFSIMVTLLTYVIGDTGTGDKFAMVFVCQPTDVSDGALSGAIDDAGLDTGVDYGAAKLTRQTSAPAWNWFFRVCENGASVGYDESITTAPEEGMKLRITRTGSSWTLSYWLPSTQAWVDQLVAAGGPTNDVYVDLFCVVENNTVSIPNGSYFRLVDFDGLSGSATKSPEDGPYVTVGGYGVGLAAGESIIDFYSGPQTTAALIAARLFLDADVDVTLGLGNESQQRRGILQVNRGTAGANKPGLVCMVDEDARPVYLWPTVTPPAGEVRVDVTGTKPATAETSGMFLGPASFAGIFVTGGAVPQTLNATPGTYDQVVGFTTDFGPSQMATPNAANDRIVLTRAGVYLVGFSCGFASDEDRLYDLRVAADGAPVVGAYGHAGNCAPGHDPSASGFGLFLATGSEVITLEATGSVGSETFTPVAMQLFVLRIG